VTEDLSVRIIQRFRQGDIGPVGGNFMVLDALHAGDK
jgi:hypothetical protein